LYGSKLTGGGDSHIGIDDYEHDYSRILYQNVMSAILELSNINVRQIHEDNKKILQNWNIVSKGI